jgi:hypothetical protein
VAWSLKTQAPRHLSRELLARAVAYRMQELVLGSLRVGGGSGEADGFRLVAGR